MTNNWEIKILHNDYIDYSDYNLKIVITAEKSKTCMGISFLKQRLKKKIKNWSVNVRWVGRATHLHTKLILTFS